MSETTDGSQSRRAFISGAAIAAVSVAAAACNGLKDPFSSQAAELQVTPSGEKVKLLSVNGEVIEVDRAFLKPVPAMPVTNSEARIGIPGKKFVMVIDLARCKNLKRCQSACNHMHHLQDGQSWIKVQKMKESGHTAPYWQPTTCMHCDEPPCVKVCPGCHF